MLPKGIKLQNEQGEEVDLDTIFASKKATVLFCYPKANTGGCTTQACNFRDSFSEVRECRDSSPALRALRQIARCP